MILLNSQPPLSHRTGALRAHPSFTNGSSIVKETVCPNIKGGRDLDEGEREGVGVVNEQGRREPRRRGDPYPLPVSAPMRWLGGSMSLLRSRPRNRKGGGAGKVGRLGQSVGLGPVGVRGILFLLLLRFFLFFFSVLCFAKCLATIFLLENMNCAT